MVSLSEFMTEQKSVSRWFILGIALVGAFCGAVLAFIFFMFGLVG